MTGFKLYEDSQYPFPKVFEQEETMTQLHRGELSTAALSNTKEVPLQTLR